jgi:ubiquinone/menaquinone biosynthesis C-methylase UbiE
MTVIRDAYTAWSSIYDLDRNLTRDLDQVVVRQALGGNRYGTVLEMGCGTGKNTTLLRQISQRLYSFDFSTGMLTQAQSKPGLEGACFTLADRAVADCPGLRRPPHVQSGTGASPRPESYLP